MTNIKFIFSLPLLLTLTFLSIAFYLNHSTPHQKLEIGKQDSAFNLNQEFLKVMSLGQKRLLADLLWVKTLLESDLEHYKQKDLNSWMYLRFNSISVLDPKFYENYLYGGQYLMIVKDDLIGAEKHFIKGLKFYRNDYQLNWNTGFLFAFEKKNIKRSIPYYQKIKDHPDRPFNFESFYSKLLLNSIGPNEALVFSKDVLKKIPETSPLYEKMKRNIYEYCRLIKDSGGENHSCE